MTIEVIEPGLLTTVQDLGRIGYQQYGVVGSGVMDELAARVGNILIGNKEEDAVLEITLMGPKLLFKTNTLVSICGADLSAIIDGEQVPLWRPVYIKAGSVLSFGRPNSGCRAYLAVEGGIDVPLIMGSRSTYLRGKIGGYFGRALQKGDVVNHNRPATPLTKEFIDYFREKQGKAAFYSVDWTVGSKVNSFYQNSVIRFIKGPQYDDFTEETKKRFVTDEFQVSPNSDRMGYRLLASPLKLKQKVDLLSEAVTKGTIQVPNDGNPIILMSDRQTIGGYPKIGYVISIDFSAMAQMKPGEKLTFKEISLEDAQRLLFKREELLSELKTGIALAVRREQDGTS